MESPCCCSVTPRIWSKVFAWIQIVLNSLGVLGSIIGIAAIVCFDIFATENNINVSTGINETSAGNVSSTEKIEDVISIIGPYIPVGSFVLVLLIFLVGAVFGVVLLSGVDQHNVKLLRRWCAYMIVYCIFYSVFTVLLTYFSIPSWWWVWSLGVNVALLSFFVLSILVVRKLIDQVQQLWDDGLGEDDEVGGQEGQQQPSQGQWSHSNDEQFELQPHQSVQSPPPGTPGYGFNPFLY